MASSPACAGCGRALLKGEVALVLGLTAQSFVGGSPSFVEGRAESWICALAGRLEGSTFRGSRRCLWLACRLCWDARSCGAFWALFTLAALC